MITNKSNIKLPSIEIKDSKTDYKKLINDNLNVFQKECLVIDIKNMDSENLNYNDFLELIHNIDTYSKDNKIENLIVLTKDPLIENQIKKMNIKCVTNKENPKTEKVENKIINNQTNIFINEKIEHIRSGSSVYAKNKNALILDSIRNGGEIIADGSVVVCGNTEGKIIAGVKDPNAYILCLNFNAELVSINGVYSKGYDLIDYSNKKVLIQLNLEGESLEIKELDNQ